MTTHPRPDRRQADPVAPLTPTPDYLIALLESAYRGPAWHGPALRVTLRGVDAASAGWRPAPGRHSAWELALHAAYARYRVSRRLDSAGPARRFPRPLASQWWPRIEPERDGLEAAWKRDRALLDDYQRELVEVLRRTPAERLGATRRGARFTLGDEVAGLALHDVYHAGQIRLLQRLREDEWQSPGRRRSAIAG